MSQKHFLIKPKEKLLEFVNEKYPLSRWNKSVIWKVNRGVYRNSRKLVIPKLKLIFMAEMASFYRISGLRDIPTCEIIEYVFGKPPEYSIDKFDEGWSIKLIERGLRIWESGLFYISPQFLRLLKSTGDQGVDKWLDDMINIKEHFEQFDDDNEEKKEFIKNWRMILRLDR